MRKQILTASMALLLFAGAAMAHHAAQTEFDLDQNILARATIVKYEAINPHTYLTVQMKGPNGQVQEWQMEALAVVGMKQKGLSFRDDLKPGHSYKIVYSPARDGKKLGFLTSIVLEDGRFVAFGPETNVTAARELSKGDPK